MLRNGICFFIGSLLMTQVVFPDEPVSPTNPKNQRVSSKLLKEALALPEYAARVSDAAPVVSMDDLKRLADKLKARGDAEGSELLMRLILEHRRLMAEVSRSSSARDETLNIHCDIIEVNFEELPADSVLRDPDFATKSSEVQAELKRLVAEKKSKSVIEPILVKMKTNEAARVSSTGEFPIPVPGGNGTVTIEFREFGAIVEILAIPTTKDNIRIQLTCETSTKDAEHAITLNGTTVPGIMKSRMQTTFESTLGETVIQAAPSPKKGHKVFVVLKATPAN